MRDPSVNAVAACNVKITNKATGLIRETKTNEAGLYTFANALAGEYGSKRGPDSAPPPSAASR